MLTKIYITTPIEGTRLVFKFFRGSDDFIMQKVYLLRLMPVCVGLIMVSCLFCHSCSSLVEYICSLIKVDWLAAKSPKVSQAWWSVVFDFLFLYQIVWDKRAFIQLLKEYCMPCPWLVNGFAYSLKICTEFQKVKSSRTLIFTMLIFFSISLLVL